MYVRYERHICNGVIGSRRKSNNNPLMNLTVVKFISGLLFGLLHDHRRFHVE